jgi:protein phosphatase
MIPTDNSHLHITAGTHAGMSGKINEDRYAVSAYHLGDINQTPTTLAIVADGIGGHHAGEVAAEYAVEIISQTVAGSDASNPIQTLQEALVFASRKIRQHAEQNTERTGMGATCACAWVIQNQLFTATVGDSRIYLRRKNTIQQLSIDHTWIQEALDIGILTPEETKGHPNQHVIRRHLGSRSTVEPDIRLRLDPNDNDQQAEANQGFQLLPGDQLLLCSDGLTDLVDDQEIMETLQSAPQEQALQELIALANQRGGHDNITIVILQMPSQATYAQPTVPVKARANRIRWACLAIIGLLLIAGIVLGSSVYIYLNRPAESAVPPTPALSATSVPQVTQPIVYPTTQPTLQAPLTQSPLDTHTFTTSSPASPTHTLTPWPTSTTAP